ncbi:DUF2683 family protein [Candidatus Woesearchaeota archaeon]|nr:DUF2683 family protein [Candidatus Woesearchaeota archaeon]
MVQALVEIDENTNRVLNVVKAKYGLKDKGEAIQIVVEKYIEEENEPDLRPEFIEKIRKTENQKGIKFKSINELRKRYS